MYLNTPYYTKYFPTTMYSCNKQKVLNKKSPLIEGFIQFLYGEWHNYMVNVPKFLWRKNSTCILTLYYGANKTV